MHGPPAPVLAAPSAPAVHGPPGSRHHAPSPNGGGGRGHRVAGTVTKRGWHSCAAPKPASDGRIVSESAALELRAGLVEAAETGEEVAAHVQHKVRTDRYVSLPGSSRQRAASCPGGYNGGGTEKWRQTRHDRQLRHVHYRSARHVQRFFLSKALAAGDYITSRPQGLAGATVPPVAILARRGKGTGRQTGRTSPSCGLFLILGGSPADVWISQGGQPTAGPRAHWIPRPGRRKASALAVPVDIPTLVRITSNDPPGRMPRRSFPQPHGPRGDHRVGRMAPGRRARVRQPGSGLSK